MRNLLLKGFHSDIVEFSTRYGILPYAKVQGCKVDIDAQTFSSSLGAWHIRLRFLPENIQP